MWVLLNSLNQQLMHVSHTHIDFISVILLRIALIMPGKSIKSGRIMFACPINNNNYATIALLIKKNPVQTFSIPKKPILLQNYKENNPANSHIKQKLSPSPSLSHSLFAIWFWAEGLNQSILIQVYNNQLHLTFTVHLSLWCMPKQLQLLLCLSKTFTVTTRNRPTPASFYIKSQCHMPVDRSCKV